MADALFENVYNPDVLSCLANLSNDEVFTPPEVANAMLDMLPQELFCDPDATFLDPACKSGVFLREIAKRLIVGLEDKIPDLQERLDHIFHKQLYGIAITELTSLISRRSLYCSKYPSSNYSLSKFESAEGNIRFKRTSHTWKNGKCIYCGATEEKYKRNSELESHAYEWIHVTKPEDILGMKITTIISNPPYQLSDGGAQASASPLYNLFVEQAKKLHPKYLTMIIPARWYSGGKGLDDFRDKMLQDRHIREIHDYQASKDCFPSVEIKGGVCYFLWDRDNEGSCKVYNHKGSEIASVCERELLETGCSTFIRYNQAVNILKKVLSFNEPLFNILISSRKPFGLTTEFVGKDKYFPDSIKIYGNKKVSYTSRNSINSGVDLIDKDKIFISYAYGAGEDFPHQIINKPFYGEPGSACTETYLVIGPFSSQVEANNAISYLQTKMLRFLVLLLKNTQHATKNVYQFVPMQDFSKAWTDEELYKKYGLTDEEITFIESMIKPMNLEGDGNDTDE